MYCKYTASNKKWNNIRQLFGKKTNYSPVILIFDKCIWHSIAIIKFAEEYLYRNVVWGCSQSEVPLLDPTEDFFDGELAAIHQDAGAIDAR